MRIREITKKVSGRQCEVTTVTLPPAMLAELDQEAERTQIRNRSALVRQAVQEFLNRRRRKVRKEVTL